MISNELFQAAIIAKLKANTALVAWLTNLSAGNEIRETSWQGAAFTYPATRAEAGNQLPGGQLSICYLTTGEITFTVQSFSESDSSKQADVLAGLVNAALMGNRLSGTGFNTLSIQSDGLTHAARTAERIWRSVGLYRVQIYET